MLIPADSATTGSLTLRRVSGKRHEGNPRGEGQDSSEIYFNFSTMANVWPPICYLALPACGSISWNGPSNKASQTWNCIWFVLVKILISLVWVGWQLLLVSLSAPRRCFSFLDHKGLGFYVSTSLVYKCKPWGLRRSRSLPLAPMLRVRSVKKTYRRQTLTFISLKRGLLMDLYDVFMGLYSSACNQVRWSIGK